MQVYNKFNDRLYREDLAKSGKFNIYKPTLEEKALKLTEWYFNLPRN